MAQKGGDLLATGHKSYQYFSLGSPIFFGLPFSFRDNYEFMITGILHSHAPCGRASEPTCRQTIIAPDSAYAPEAPSRGHSPHGAYNSALRSSPFHHRVRPPYTAPAGHRDPFRPDSFHRRSIRPCSAETLYCRWTRCRCGSVRCIESNFPVAFDGWEDKQAAQREITSLKKCLLECAGVGLVQCSPGWCTGYNDYKGTCEAIAAATKVMRDEVKNTPTWKQYKRESA